MGTISLKNAGHRAGDLLFSSLDLVIADGDRVGLVAPNGRGKSTLLRAMAGLAELSEGSITRSRGLTLGYVPQEVPDVALPQTLSRFVASALDAATLDAEGWRVDVVLDEMAIPAAFRDKPLAELSGGWQRMALLARCWVTQPDALLMDEPTNHLDLGRIMMLEEWMSYAARSLPVVIASHDRAFLDATTNRTLFLRPTEQVYLPLAYSAARAELDQIDAAAQAQRDKELKYATQLRKQAAKLTNVGINSGSDLLVVKSKQLRDRAEKIEAQVQDVHRDRTGLVKLSNSGADARVMMAFDDVPIATPDGRALFTVDKLHIFQGDRIVLLGRNGRGKSQFMRVVTEALGGGAPKGLRISPQLTPGYLDQALAWLPLESSPLEYILHRFDEGDRRTIALLAGAGFPPDRQTKSIRTLSLGQRARVALLALRLEKPNFYLLDEPTNHLDIPGQEQLEADIREQGATTILVTHDRAFLRAVGTRFLLIDRKKLVEVDGPEEFLADQASS
ncbi:ATPase components of ABC transporters with duplicated ATPase domains [Devosia lucknowensis]|uniref:ATPase components of ABC transporters with duplicated ATPase domains n=1 Tax=Devosia lucknowensis TaxID=1096929 RepID=A0A1Y6EP47_9HYPH|nr:ABC-F family ATP-binding cassette domain-containing protein [Devosia lucknowensis]SMQ64126.1 ATPase components of ABC transporters with duplicated ATPase domains [Devosia lucknowensis]